MLLRYPSLEREMSAMKLVDKSTKNLFLFRLQQRDNEGTTNGILIGKSTYRNLQ